MIPIDSKGALKEAFNIRLEELQVGCGVGSKEEGEGKRMEEEGGLRRLVGKGGRRKEGGGRRNESGLQMGGTR